MSQSSRNGKPADSSRRDAQPAAPRSDEYEGKGKFEGGLLGRLLRFALPHKHLLLFSLVLFPLVAAAQLGQPYLLKLAIDGPITDRLPEAVVPYALALLGLVVVQAVFQFTQNVIMQLAGQRIMQDVRNALFRKVLGLAPSYFDRTPIGKVMTRLTGDVEALNEFLSSGLVTVAADSILLVGIVGVMLWLDPTLAAISFVFVLPLVIGVAKLRGIMRQVFRSLRNRSTAMNVYLNESIVGMTIVQAFRREERNRAEYEELTDGWYTESTKSLWLNSSLTTAVQFAQTLTLALLLYVTLDGAFGLTVSVGLVVAFVDYIERFYAPIENLSGRFAILQTALASAEKIFRLLDEQDVLPETETPHTIEPLAQGLELKGVDFTYATGEQVLYDVDLKVPRGHTVALVGATGAGKSTIVKLLGRFYDPSAGAVTWDGTDLRDFASHDLRGRIAYVPQETFLFSDSLAANIALDPDRIDVDRVVAAAAAVQADQVAADLPQGYDQVLGERGHDLSAGERQLVSFARALAHDPDVLILDEATANIDGETEAKIQTALETLLEGRTAVVIAHRLSTIEKADQIVVLHKGRVKERGTHAELLAKQGLYWKLYRLQSEEAA